MAPLITGRFSYNLLLLQDNLFPSLAGPSGRALPQNVSAGKWANPKHFKLTRRTCHSPAPIDLRICTAVQALAAYRCARHLNLRHRSDTKSWMWPDVSRTRTSTG